MADKPVTDISQFNDPFQGVQNAQKNTFNSKVDEVAAKTGGTTRSNPKDPVIYMGANSRIAFMKTTDAALMYYKWDSGTKNRFMTQLGLAGYDVSKMRDEDMAAVWSGYVTAAGRYSQAGQNISPWDIMAKDRMQRESAMAKPRTVTSTSTSYDMSTKQDAHAIFLSAAQQLLGRDPTKAEISTFQRSLNAYEKANPTTTTTTTNYAGTGEVTSQSSTTKGGVSADSKALMAMEDVKKDPEYGAYQAATNGMNWLMEMIGG